MCDVLFALQSLSLFLSFSFALMLIINIMVTIQKLCIPIFNNEPLYWDNNKMSERRVNVGKKETITMTSDKNKYIYTCSMCIFIYLLQKKTISTKCALIQDYRFHDEDRLNFNLIIQTVITKILFIFIIHYVAFNFLIYHVCLQLISLQVSLFCFEKLIETDFIEIKRYIFKFHNQFL